MPAKCTQDTGEHKLLNYLRISECTLMHLAANQYKRLNSYITRKSRAMVIHIGEGVANPIHVIYKQSQVFIKDTRITSPVYVTCNYCIYLIVIIHVAHS